MVTENNMVKSPLVSVCVQTYQHAPYIREALESILMQKTDFPFEILLGEDESTDGTREICIEYEKKYPHLIRLFLNSRKNVTFIDGNPTGRWNLMNNLKNARGKYIALLSGDDYWIAPDKLEKQVGLLEKYPEAVMVVAKTHVYRQESDGLHYLSTTQASDKELLYLDDSQNYYHPSTYMIRAPFKEVISKYFTRYNLFGDTALRAILITYGPFVLLPEVVSVYRLTGNGIWSSLTNEEKLKGNFEIARKLAEILRGKHAAYQREKVWKTSLNIFKIYIKEGRFIDMVKFMPFIVWFGTAYVSSYMRRKL